MRACHNCVRMRVIPTLTFEIHSDDAQIIRYTCAKNRFVSVQPKNPDELRALLNQAAFCPHYKES